MHNEFSQSIGPTSDDTTTCGLGRSPIPSGLTSSAVDSPAKTSATPDLVKESTAPAPDCFLNLPESFANWSRESLCWKTSQRCLIEGWATFSELWPRSGLMRSGRCFRRRPLVPRTYARGCSLWPTARKNDFQPICWHRARLFAIGKYKRAGGGMCNLNDWSGLWAIRNTHPHLLTKDGHEHHKTTGSLPVLSVEFAEQCMGFPVGWTELDALETP